MTKKIFFILFLLFCSQALAKKVVTIYGGQVHLRGMLLNSACAVVADSQNMNVNMGQFSNRSFSSVGDFDKEYVPFTIKLTDCKLDTQRYVGISFVGDMAENDPQVFKVENTEDVVSENVGLGLAIFDEKQSIIIPNGDPIYYGNISGDELNLHFSAKYRLTHKKPTLGKLQTQVWFLLSYL